MAKGKAEKGTPKWLANKMKSKGLQKLRWYCQMCQKQCRDANGFKCHIQSESHQRQMLLFGEKSGQYVYEFSREFERDFMDILRRCHGTKRVFANVVYQEYIRDKNHVHMNATRWCTLSGFVRYLGSSGKAKIEESEKGWWITWIDRDPETVARQEALQKRDKMSKDDDERMADFVAKQVERQREKYGQDTEDDKYTELVRMSEDEKISIGLKLEKKEVKDPLILKPLKFNGPKVEKKKRSSSSDKYSKRPKTAIEELIEEDKREKEYKAMKKREKDEFPWLKKNIIVKITTKSLGDKFYKAKGQVLETHQNRFKATLSLCSDNTKVTIDQNEVETVIPSIGRKVLILQGKFRGSLAILKELNVEKFCAELQICDEDLIGSLPYEHFSKYVD